MNGSFHIQDYTRLHLIEQIMVLRGGRRPARAPRYRRWLARAKFPRLQKLNALLMP